jgi:hypothetical protein
MYYYNEPTEQEVKKSRERAEELNISLEEYLLLRLIKGLNQINQTLNAERY